jgi:hypothetical protein
MLTDLARRNQARMCGALGIEHLLVSADIKSKRENIRKNVTAWMKRPTLGMVPIFMAGDKQYFYYANRLAKRFQLRTIFMCENPLERTHFKHGFCGITHRHADKPPYFLSFSDKVRMAFYYLKEFLLNPAYINSSLLDTAMGYVSYYLIPHRYVYLFDYIRWDEEEINGKLLGQYRWETAKDTDSTWRIGDGTAPFYNYIYYLVAGFTENDTFQSNQVREGVLTREAALALAAKDNMPRYESIQWYCDIVGLDFFNLLKTLHSIPKQYR